MNLFPEIKIVLMQAVPFLATLVVLKYVILDSLLEYLIQRRDRSASEGGRLDELSTEVATAEAAYQSKVAELKKGAVVIRERALAVANSEEEKIISAAQSATNAQLESFRLSLGGEIEKARQELNTDISPLANNVAASILGRSLATGGK